MDNVKAIILRAAGINCDMETQHALTLAGAASADRVHINRVIENPSMLDGYQILVVPGGFSYGDDVAAGKILANQTVHHLSDILHRFIEAGKLVLGICNGFQVLIKTGIVPGLHGAGKLSLESDVTLTDNDCGHFVDRWIHLTPGTDKCVFIEKGRNLYLPIAHGEGKIVANSPESLRQIAEQGCVAFRYCDENGQTGPFPVNPNGSMDSIAALTDTTGRVMGMMPHPERFVRWTQHPHWTRLKNRDGITDGMTIFTNAVSYIKENF
jgi:phosphoribosylformylglycinamidine synthase